MGQQVLSYLPPLLLLFVRLQRTFSLLLFVRLHLLSPPYFAPLRPLSTPISRPCTFSLLLFVRLQHILSPLLLLAPAPSLHSYFSPLHLLSAPISRPCNISSLHSSPPPLLHIPSPLLFLAPAPSRCSYLCACIFSPLLFRAPATHLLAESLRAECRRHSARRLSSPANRAAVSCQEYLHNGFIKLHQQDNSESGRCQ